MEQMNSSLLNDNTPHPVDALFSEISRAVGPMFLVFSVTAIGWLALHSF